MNYLLIIVSSIIFTSLADRLYATESKTQVYTIGVENIDYSPLFAFNKTPSAAQSILEMFAEQEGLQFIYTPMPVVELYYHLSISKTIDFKFPDAPAWRSGSRLGKKPVYSDPVLSYCDVVLLSPKAANLDLKQLKTIGIVKGFSPLALQPYIDNKQITVLRTESVEKLLESATDNRLNAIYINYDVGKYLLKQKPHKKVSLTVNPELPSFCGAYRLSTVKYPQLINRFNLFMISHQKEIQAIKKQFGLLHSLPDNPDKN
jgi:hypothetical protein